MSVIDGKVKVEVRGDQIFLIISDGEREGTIFFTLTGAIALAEYLERAVRYVEKMAMGDLQP